MDRQQGQHRAVAPLGERVRQPTRQLLAHIELQAGVVLLQLGNDERQQIRSDRRRQAEAQDPGEFPPAAHRERADLVGVRQHPPGDLDDLRAERGDHDLVACPLHELRAETHLERLELFAERRLGGVRPLRRAPEMPRFIKGHQVLELSEIGHLASRCMRTGPHDVVLIEKPSRTTWDNR